MTQLSNCKTPGRVGFVALLAALCLAPGCGVMSSESKREAEARARAELQDQVRTLRQVSTASISLAAELGQRIADGTADLSQKRESVVSRQRFANEAMGALWTDPPLLGLLDVWALVMQYQEFARQRLQGHPYLEEASAAVQRLLEGVDTEMQRILGERFSAARASIEKFAADRPIQDGFVRLGVTHAMLDDPKTMGLFAWIPEFKLNPFDSVGQGLGESAQAIETVGRSVDRFTDMANLLPMQLSWQLELLQYQLAGDPQFKAISAGFADTATAANAAVAAIETAPASIRQEVVAALEELDPKLAEVRATLTDVQAAADSLTPTAQSFDAAAQSLAAMAAQLDITLKTFNQTYILLDGDPKAPPPAADAPKTHPFDVREFDAAGQSMTAMAAQLQQTLDTFNQLIRDPALTERIGEASGSATSTIRSVVWTVVGGVLALAAGLAVVLFGYRRLTRQPR